MTALLRFLFVIPFAFIAACLTAAFSLLWPFLDASRANGNPFFWIDVAILFIGQAAQVGGTIFLPWALAMIVSEIFGLRSILLHIAAGLVAGFAIATVAYGGEMPSGSVATALVVASLSFALVYWILAGRNAGLWRREFRASDTDTERF